MYCFDECPDRADTDSVKHDRYAGTDILPLWVADMDFPVAPEIIKALEARLTHPLYGYTHAPDSLNEVVVERMYHLYEWTIKPEWLVWVPGVVASVNIACRSLARPGRGILSPAVVYPYISAAPELNGHRLRRVPMVLQNRRWIMDLDWIDARDDVENEMLLLCNPHNPGGSVYTHDELSRLEGIAGDKGLIIVSDEVHCELVLDREARHIPIASLNEAVEKRSITLMAASKTFNLAGLGCSFAIIPDQQLRQNFKRASQGLVSHINLFGYIATRAAYEHGEQWRQQLLEYLRGNRDYLMEEINGIRGLTLLPVEATYLAWIDVSGLDLDDPHGFFERAGVGMSPGREFGDKGFMRLNFGCSRAMLEKAVSRIRNAVNQHWDGSNV